MPGQLLPVNFKHPYRALMWTIERDPAAHVPTHRQHLHDLFTDQYAKKGLRLCVACEVSPTGYAHDHVCTYTPVSQKVPTKFIKKLQRSVHFKKTNGTRASVRVHHPRQGSSVDYTLMTKYLTESRYKSKDLDDGTLTFDDPGTLWHHAYLPLWRDYGDNRDKYGTLSLDILCPYEESDGQCFWNELWRTHDELRRCGYTELAGIARTYLATGPTRTDKPNIMTFMSEVQNFGK